MSQLAKLDDYTRPCSRCDVRRYVTVAHGDVAAAKTCPVCFATCPACHDSLFVRVVDERGYEFVRPCPVCGPLRKRIAAYNSATLPAHYYERGTFPHFETYEPNDDGRTQPIGNLDKARSFVYNWTRGFVPGERGFLLWGDVGTGKTHLLAATIRILTLEKGFSARFVEFSHLLSEIREGFDQGRGESAVLGPLTEIPILAIDELGKGRNNEWQLSIIDEIISKRYNRNLTTLFTTNYLVDPPQPRGHHDGDFRRQATLETLRERIGDRIFSRLFEMCEFARLDAPDFRKRHTGPSSVI